MMRIMFTCELKPDAVDEDLALLKEVYAELEVKRPAGMRYDTFQADDGVTLVSLVELEGGPEAMHGLPAFQRYRSTLEQRCVRPPSMTVLNELGTYSAP
ncbi:hypothetical protein [Streptomonospora salina]|uniref:Antibiotic biosynthesis monooxygenase n=1 Tax=Streptomonospora salina TaxID=104205 RepID=A0A841EAR8_9ACTN|nr:hypothetical protein [Streptomonospora salina]MBB5998153.1 hypothetical protein [Streptomonospora salina]